MAVDQPFRTIDDLEHAVRALAREFNTDKIEMAENNLARAGLSRFVEAIRVGSPNFFEVRIGKDYDIVFRSNCDKLGLLPPETAARTVGFYYLVSSIVEDINLLRDAGESPVYKHVAD